MTKVEFQQLHGFSEEFMKKLDAVLRIFKGKIVSIDDKINVDKPIK